MIDIWSWICELPNSNKWIESAYVLELASSKHFTRGIQLIAEKIDSNSDVSLITFTISLNGFHPFTAPKTLWVSDKCPLSSDKPFLPLVLQLLQEIISRSPTAPTSTCPRSRLQNLKPDPVSWIMGSHSPESFSSFFNLVFITRLFWLCVCDAPSEAGSLFFDSLFVPNLDALSCEHVPVLRSFLVSVGVDAELCFMRTVGYMLAKWLILREVGGAWRTLAPATGQQSQHVGFSYAMEANGLWVLKGYAPILAMTVSTSSRGYKFLGGEPKEAVLKYALAHQQLEAVIQMEYSVEFKEGYIHVHAQVDNIRFHVARLGFSKTEVDYAEDRHFVSRARVWVGPEVGATYVGGLSLARSTSNAEREVEVERIVKGNYKKTKTPKLKTTARMRTRTRMKNWRWDQDIEGNAAIFDAVLYDNKTGHEISTCKFINNARDNVRGDGPNRPFTKTGGLVFAGDEYGEGVGWRLSKEMEGSVLKWRIGGQVWVTYWPSSEVENSYFETRTVEWCDEVDLPLIPRKYAY